MKWERPNVAVEVNRTASDLADWAVVAIAGIVNALGW